MENRRYPDKLEALVPRFIGELPIDPFSGRSFIYQTEGKGFIVTSIGPNRKTDESKAGAAESERDDIVWRCSR